MHAYMHTNTHTHTHAHTHTHTHARAHTHTQLDGMCEYVIHIPKVDEVLSPILTVVPFQLLAYHIAIMRGCDVDMPRNLAKSVTTE